MADHNPTAPIQASPPTIAGNTATLNITSSECIVSFGQSKAVFDREGKAVGLSVEWAISISMGLPAVVALKDQLEFAIKTYESRFGTIPRDPALKVEMAQTAGIGGLSKAAQKKP